MSAGADAGQRPIIIKKKKGGHGHGHHGGAWKVAFADFATAMMALFLVLWLVGQSPKTKSAVGAYFRDPLGLAGGGNTDVNTGPHRGGAGFFDGGNTAIAIDTQLSSAHNGEGAQDTERQILELSNARNRLAQALMALPSDSWARHVELAAVDEGLRIEIQDSATESLFAAGGSKIQPAARAVLSLIAQEIALLPNRVVVEGHTDGSPARGGASNWELSAARANAARRFLVENGLRVDQVVEVRGYADRRLRVWHDPSSARNRRISVLVLLEGPSAAPAPAAAEEAAHPLVQKLDRLDVAAQGPSKVVEVDPSGRRR
jgi:chemotaxis protein MotB